MTRGFMQQSRSSHQGFSNNCITNISHYTVLTASSPPPTLHMFRHFKFPKHCMPPHTLLTTFSRNRVRYQCKPNGGKDTSVLLQLYLKCRSNTPFMEPQCCIVVLIKISQIPGSVPSQLYQTELLIHSTELKTKPCEGRKHQGEICFFSNHITSTFYI